MEWRVERGGVGYMYSCNSFNLLTCSTFTLMRTTHVTQVFAIVFEFEINAKKDIVKSIHKYFNEFTKEKAYSE